MAQKTAVYGIGNVLMDILVRVTDGDLRDLGLAKGTMHLTDGEERERILSFIKHREVIYNCGGSAPNVVITLTGLGVTAGLSGKIGDDDFGRVYERRLTEHGAVSFLSRGEGCTGSSVIMISPDSERTMNTHLGINRDYSPAELNPEAIAESDYFFFTGYMWDTPKQKAALTRAMEIAKESGTKIVFDAADPFAVRRHHGEFLHLIENHFDVVLANREEARLIFDCDDIDICVEKLGSLCDTAIVKDGPRGSIISHRGGIYPSKDKACLVSTTCPVSTYRIPVNKVEAVDTTGAGDIYAAGFLYGLCRGWPTPRAGKFASYLAGQIVCLTGAQFPREETVRIRKELADGSWDRFE